MSNWNNQSKNYVPLHSTKAYGGMNFCRFNPPPNTERALVTHWSGGWKRENSRNYVGDRRKDSSLFQRVAPLLRRLSPEMRRDV